VPIDAGDSHVVYLDDTGSVWCWGLNADGQVGDNTSIDRYTPYSPTELPAVDKIAAGSFHSMALSDTGTVWVWGGNATGQLGNGNRPTISIVPEMLTGLTGITDIAAGTGHSLALQSDGSILAWGENSSGQLGTGDFVDSSVPVPVTGVAGIRFVDIAAGENFSMALSEWGTVYTWGENESGQLGNNDATGTDRNYPDIVNGLIGIRSITVGFRHALVLQADGTILAWGENSDRQCGNIGADGADALEPVEMANITTPASAIAMAGGRSYSAVILNDNLVYTCGGNSWGQLGYMDPFVSQRDLLGVVENFSGGQTVACGDVFTVVRNTDGTIWTWGSNSNGQLGIDPATTYSLQAVNVTGF
jgi:alpha-tubulin suppressor-like RCC1 family protein